jgi:cytochrome c oxidase subunit 4
MSLQEAAAAGARAAHEETVTGVGHAHPTDRAYIGIALILAVITAAEVVTFYVEEHLGSLLVPVLLVMMTVKFIMVAGYFMHLRFDSNLFTRLFVSGVVLAVLVYLAALTTFEFFSGDDGDDTPVTDERGTALVIPLTVT